MAEVLIGGCACGKVRYRLSGEPIITHTCHCRHCQRETGSAFAVNMLYECDRVDWEGEPEDVLTPSASGKGQHILRCPSCHVAVSSHYSGSGDALHFIRAGTLDDSTQVRPDVHIYTSTRQGWFALPEEAPAFTEFYDPKVVWSDDMMSRWRKALGQ